MTMDEDKVHWCQLTTGDVMLDQRTGAEFQANPHKVKATWLERSRDKLVVGVRDDLTWFVNRVDVDLGLRGQRMTMIRRWATATVPLVGDKPYGVAQVVAVETEDGHDKFRYELTLGEDGQPSLAAMKLDASGKVVQQKMIPLG